MKRIMIIGCGGSGKSTLARQLGQKLEIPVIHLDQLFWTPGWVSVSREEFDRLHEAALAEDQWIMDGNFDRTIPRRLQRCDTVIYLDYSRFTCIWGWLRRVIKHHGKARPDMAPGCGEWLDPEFFQWLWNFNKKYRKSYHEMLSGLGGKKVYIFISNAAAGRIF